MVQVVNRGDRPRRMRVSVHGSRHPYSVHPAVMGQLIVLSEPGKGEGAREVRESRGGIEKEDRRRKQGEKWERNRGGGGRGERRREEGAGRRERGGRNKNKVRKEKSTEHELNTQKPNQPKQRVESCGGKCF